MAHPEPPPLPATAAASASGNGRDGKLPLALKLTAGVFLLWGAGGVIELLRDLPGRGLQVTPALVGAFIGHGLLSRRSGWRRVAIVWLWVTMICLPLLAVFSVFYSDPGCGYLHLGVLGRSATIRNRAAAIAIPCACLMVSVWQYRVLIRADVRQLFNPERANAKVLPLS